MERGYGFSISDIVFKVLIKTNLHIDFQEITHGKLNKLDLRAYEIKLFYIFFK